MAQASSTLLLHCGARLVNQDELAQVKAPPPEGRWFPIPHVAVYRRVKETLGEAGYVVKKEQLALSRGDNRFFGVMDLATPLSDDVVLAVGIRNSTDRSFPISFAAGSRTLVCDNLALRSDLICKRKHSRFGEQRFAGDIAAAVQRLGSFREIEQNRIKLLMDREVSDVEADSVILKSFEKGIVSAPYLPRIIREWRTPSFPEFEPRTAWNLLQAFTTVLGERAKKTPSEYALQTMRLNAHLEPLTAGMKILDASEVQYGTPA